MYRRAKILLMKSEGKSNNAIAVKLDISVDAVRLCLNKFSEGGIHAALKNAPGRGRKTEIFDDTKTWIVNIACQKPSDFGLSAELWYPTSLTNYIRANAKKEGYSRLETVSVSKVRTILRNCYKINLHFDLSFRPSASSKNLDVARYACDFSICI